MSQPQEDKNGTNLQPPAGQPAGEDSKPKKDESLEENLEKLAALNLSSDRSMQPRLSNAMIRLVSAAAGIGALVLLYYLFKLFI